MNGIFFTGMKKFPDLSGQNGRYSLDGGQFRDRCRPDFFKGAQRF